MSSVTDDRPEAILAVRLPARLRDALRVEADAHQRSMSGQVRWLIEQSLPHAANGNGAQASDNTGRKAA